MVGTQTAASAANPERLTRRLTAILVADVVGSTRMMEQDEVGTLAAMHAFMTEIAAPTVAKHRGNVIKTTGDGAVVEFGSPVEAVICAFEVQRRLSDWVSPKLGERHLTLRIGINLGDVICGPDGDLYGDGVNVAVRLQQVAEPEALHIGEGLRRAAWQLDQALRGLGEQSMKNIARPIHIYVAREAVPREARSSPTTRGPFRFSSRPQAVDRRPAVPQHERGQGCRLPCRWHRRGHPDRARPLQMALRHARGSTFTYKGTGPQPEDGRRRTRRPLSSQRQRRGPGTDAHHRSAARAEKGTQIWAHQYDSKVEDVFELQDRITESVAGAVEPRLRHARSRGSGARRPRSWDPMTSSCAPSRPSTKEPERG